MKVKRTKQAKKVLLFYKHSFAFREPYQVIGKHMSFGEPYAYVGCCAAHNIEVSCETVWLAMLQNSLGLCALMASPMASWLWLRHGSSPSFVRGAHEIVSVLHCRQQSELVLTIYCFALLTYFAPQCSSLLLLIAPILASGMPEMIGWMIEVVFVFVTTVDESLLLLILCTVAIWRLK